MTEMMMYSKHIPEYYDAMYLDGYTPYEILEAASRKMYNDHLARKEAGEVIIPTINFTSTVKIK